MKKKIKDKYNKNIDNESENTNNKKFLGKKRISKNNNIKINNFVNKAKLNDNDVVEVADDENGNEDEEDSIQYKHLGNNSFLNGSYNHVLKQNTDLIKTQKYYFIDYQYMVKELFSIS